MDQNRPGYSGSDPGCQAWLSLVQTPFATRLSAMALTTEGAQGGEINRRPMCTVQDSFKHWTAARRRIDYRICECPAWRKATGGSGSIRDK